MSLIIQWIIEAIVIGFFFFGIPSLIVTILDDNKDKLKIAIDYLTL